MMVPKKKRFFWVLIFILVAILLAALATFWNVVLVNEYQRWKLFQVFSLHPDFYPASSGLILKMILGTFGFIATLSMTILLFHKLLREMKLNQLQSEFLATVSHELKTPLASLELTSSLLKTSTELTEQEKEQLWTSHRLELQRLKEDVETLLEAAHCHVYPVQKGCMPLHLETWIQETKQHWETILGPESYFQREGVALDLYIWVNPKSLNLIIHNLVSNAKKFAKGKPELTLRTNFYFKTHHQATWSLRFEDQGWGFPQADSKKIFQRFFRSSNPAPYAIPGTGLGLYLAHSASQAMGLSLTAECPHQGQGAHFILEGPQYFLKVKTNPPMRKAP